ncbi:unnamed protein product (macronuclear) [Paramecium tetraurelia]|uniref:Histone deacetylase complex subunit SAP30 Sin3 binding domain-containing protein n=1 Tax=Paramecium tetraurelia TaxID=5888 RepID=A0D2D8_PARTE|nr:uncharacterized protein GSPATT00012711001 [Paramecium tetraurelia]CAK77205.1 unnamed protein product [Paramecium tetraurelia]|eukprot:XP_001444602.1 hypothetical protein (macronuclear) [Paramecium tetraurelia strain d4-2]
MNEQQQPIREAPMFFNISKLSQGSLQRYQTFYQKEQPFLDQNSTLTLEQKVQSHFEQLKLDDKVVLEKFLRLKKDETQAALAKRNPRKKP